jgi:hypothetical protein
MIVDEHGKELKSQRNSPCPQCGRLPKEFLPSAGFGNIVYTICPCGKQFKELPWQKPGM